MKSLIILTITFVALLVVSSDATAGESDLLRQSVWDGAFKSGAHVRYHEKLADNFECWDNLWRWTSILFGVIALTGPLIFHYIKKKSVEVAWGIVGVIALVLAIVGTFSKSASRYTDHAILEKRWALLESQWDRLLRDRDDIPRQELMQRVNDLLAQQNAIETAEPPGEAGPELKKAWEEEATARNVRIPSPLPDHAGLPSVSTVAGAK